MSATEDAYLGVTIDVPDGPTIEAKPVPFKRGLQYTLLLDAAQAGDGEAWLTFLNTFSGEMETVDGVKFEDLPLSVYEMFSVAGRFLARNRLAETPAETEAEASDASPDDASPPAEP